MASAKRISKIEVAGDSDHHRKHACGFKSLVESMLAQACAALDRAEELAAVIDADGPPLLVKKHAPRTPCLKGELANRAFLVRKLQRLGLNVEAIKPIGRPAGY